MKKIPKNFDSRINLQWSIFDSVFSVSWAFSELRRRLMDFQVFIWTDVLLQSLFLGNF